ncbi:hypothetical protein H6G76_22120 [Nostoc sp. FACHB-152]|nr:MULTISPECIES: hypothetical protein [unclassified Nostoc]MBD2449812.1 hypothetical protein [Nostoc sp. FACHB-152]MBD2471609.1 hypothetical protein [Nostoc sp. FACHB-145]
MEDQRVLNLGSSNPLLDDVQQALLWQALQEPPDVLLGYTLFHPTYSYA